MLGILRRFAPQDSRGLNLVLFTLTPLFPAVIEPESNAGDDESQQAPLLDVGSAAEDVFDGAAEVVAGGADDRGPDQAGDRFESAADSRSDDPSSKLLLSEGQTGNFVCGMTKIAGEA